MKQIVFAAGQRFILVAWLAGMAQYFTVEDGEPEKRSVMVEAMGVNPEM